jgi:hypothetical protein
VLSNIPFQLTTNKKGIKEIKSTTNFEHHSIKNNFFLNQICATTKNSAFQGYFRKKLLFYSKNNKKQHFLF